MKPWDGIIPIEEQEAYRAAGFGRPTGIGSASGPAHHRRAIPHGRHRAAAVPRGDQGISDLVRGGRLDRGEEHRVAPAHSFAKTTGPCCTPTFRPRKRSTTAGCRTRCRPSWAWRRAAMISSPRSRRREGDVLLPKKHPSAFFGTPLASYLVGLGADTLVVTGCTTSGCVRGTVVDGFAYNFRVAGSARLRLRPQRRVACGQFVRHEREVRRRHELRRSDQTAARHLHERQRGNAA